MVKAGVWTTIEVDLPEEAVLGNYLKIGIGHTLGTTVEGVTYMNPGSSHADWATLKDQGLYFDNFVVNTNSDDYLWTQTSVANYMVATVNEDSAYIKEGDYSLKLAPGGANWPTFTFAKSATIDWTKASKISFEVYNPTERDWVISCVVSTKTDQTEFEYIYQFHLRRHCNTNSFLHTRALPIVRAKNY